MLSSILYQVLVLLASAVILGEVFRQLGFSSVAGELISGIIVGPSVLGLVTNPQDLSPLAFVSLFFIIYQLGFNTKTEKLKAHVLKGMTVTVTSFVAPFLIILFTSNLVFGFGTTQDFILALAVSVPSISIVSVLVRDTGVQEKEPGHIILAGIVIIDVLSFILLAAATRAISDTLRTILFTVLFILAFLAVDYFISLNPARARRFFRRAGKMFKGEEIAYAILIVIGLVISELFQIMGLVYVLGAFFAALVVHEEAIGLRMFEKVSNTVNSMNKAFFAPFFFGYAGSEVILLENSYRDIAIIVAIALFVAFLSMSFTYYLSGKIFTGDRENRRSISVILAGKGSVGIVIANVALDAGIITYSVNSLIILSTIVGSLVVTLLLRRGEREMVE